MGAVIVHTAIKGWVAGNVSAAYTFFANNAKYSIITIPYTLQHTAQWFDKLVKGTKISL